MDKKKIVLSVIFILIIFWIIYVIIDCSRLSNYYIDDKNGKPILTIKTEKYENIEEGEYLDGTIKSCESGIIYTGLGYSKSYYKKWQEINNKGNIPRNGTITKIFGIIPVWGYEEN